MWLAKVPAYALNKWRHPFPRALLCAYREITFLIMPHEPNGKSNYDSGIFQLLYKQCILSPCSEDSHWSKTNTSVSSGNTEAASRGFVPCLLIL